MTNYILYFHIIGALILGLFVLATIFILSKKKSAYYKNFAIYIAYGSALQILSGVLLSAVQAEKMSLLAYCSRLGLYLAILFITEFMIYMAMKNKNIIFPSKLVFNSTALAIFLAIIFY